MKLSLAHAVLLAASASAALVPSDATALATASPTVLARRAAKACSLTSQCSQSIPLNSHRLCSNKLCSYSCNSGYKASGSTCIKIVTTTSKKVSTTAKSSSKTTTRKSTTTTKKATTTSKKSTATTKAATSSKKTTSTTSKQSSSTSKSTTKSTTRAATTTAGTSKTSASSRSTSAAAAATPRVPSLRKVYSGAGFFDEWTFEAIPDPTNGMVNYVNRTQAQALGLVSTTSGVAQISIDRNSTLAPWAYRNSVRIISDAKFNVGTLMLLDMSHAPHGCSVWGAAWAFSPSQGWPVGGEIDIYEGELIRRCRKSGVNERTFNTYTLHTPPGCTRDTSLPITGLTTGTQVECDVAVNSNAGCGVIDSSPSSFGAGFNAAKGGVIAVSIKTTGISVWRWTRSAIPSDVASGSPKPTSWGTPIAQWGNSTCNTASYFKDLQMVFDITTCGDWAGNSYVWQSKADSGSCSSKYSTCMAAMQDPANFAEAYFDVNYIKLYDI